MVTYQLLYVYKKELYICSSGDGFAVVFVRCPQERGNVNSAFCFSSRDCKSCWLAADCLSVNPVYGSSSAFVETLKIVKIVAWHPASMCPRSLYVDLQGERPTVEADGVLHDRGGGARGGGGRKLVPVLRTGLQQPGNADVREVRNERLSKSSFEAGMGRVFSQPP